MSARQFFADLFTGNFDNAEARFMDWWNGSAKPELKSFLAAAGSAEGAIMESLVDVAVKDVEANGFTTASFVTAGKDVLAQLVAQNISAFSIQHVMAMLNIAAAPLAAANATPAPATDTPAPDAATPSSDPV